MKGTTPLVKDIALGFPVNRTYEASTEGDAEYKHYKEVLEELEKSATVQNVKIIIHCDEAEKKECSKEGIESRLMQNPNIKSVTVSYEVKKGLHVRSEKILKIKSASEKLEEYIRINELKGSPELYALADDIERSLEISYSAPCHSFSLLWMKLRGSTGIKEGMGKEEYILDFTKFMPGVIALSAVCGRGKSTLIENCQPWVRMLTRSGKLQDHFYLKDSYRELMYQDEEGRYYHISILIDGKTASGKVKAFAQTGMDINALEPVVDCDGNVEPYEKWVDSTFGSIELFLRTAFFTKGNTTGIADISATTKGEKRSFFNSLMGTEKLALISQKAREKSKELKADIASMEALVTDIDYDAEIRDKKSAIKEMSASIEVSKSKAAECSEEIDRLKKSIVPVDDIKRQLESCNKHVQELEGTLLSWKDKKNILEKWNLVQAKYNAYVGMTEKKDGLDKKLSAKTQELNSFFKELNSLTRKKDEYQKVKNAAYIEYAALQKAIPDSIDETCPTCGQKLPGDKIKELTAQFEARKNELKVLKENFNDAERKLDAAEQEISDYQNGHIAPAEQEIESLQNEIRSLEKELENFPGDLLSLKSAADTYSGEDVNGHIESLTKSILEGKDECKEIESKLAGINNSDIEEKIRAVSSEMDEINSRIQELNISLGGETKELELLMENKEKTEAAAQKIAELNRQQADYELIEKAFGANGIQALEMEAMSPDVASITNMILHSAYGDKFKVSFQTLKIGSKGNLIEDFSIIVENTETGSSKPLEWLSGGESVWIKEALFHAFSVIRMRSTMFSFKINFLDEADGALDHDSKLRYLKMIEKARVESGLEKTVLITHSQELKDVIEQKIEL